MPKAIEVEHLRFSYPDGTPALADVSFSIEPGESVGLIGPNGAGKTTLLLHLNGILKGEGRIRVDGLELCEKNLPAVRKKVGVVFQDPETQLFMPTVFEDVAFGPIHMGLGIEEISRRVGRALGRVDLAESGKKISHHLSFGEKKRVSIATVLSMEPEILVLDEPTGNLDPKHRSQLMLILKSAGGTKLIASHDIEMVFRLTDRVLLLREGRVAMDGPTQEILGDHALLRQSGFYPVLP